MKPDIVEIGFEELVDKYNIIANTKSYPDRTELWKKVNKDKWNKYCRNYRKINITKLSVGRIKGILKELGISFDEALFMTGLDIKKKLTKKK